MFSALNLFMYDSYRTFLNDLFKTKDFLLLDLEIELGYKSSSLSKIVNKQASLPLEKSYLLCKLLDFNEFQTNFFTNLVLCEDSGTAELRAFYTRKNHRLITEVINKYGKSLNTQDVKRKALKNVDFHNGIGVRSLYTMHFLLSKAQCNKIRGIYIHLLYEVLKAIESDDSPDLEKNSHYLNLDLFTGLTLR